MEIGGGHYVVGALFPPVRDRSPVARSSSTRISRYASSVFDRSAQAEESALDCPEQWKGTTHGVAGLPSMEPGERPGEHERRHFRQPDLKQGSTDEAVLQADVT